MQSKVAVLSVLIAVMLFSCDTNSVFDEYKAVPNVWNKNEVVSFNVKVPDSTKPYNLFVNLRNTKEYKYSNLFLIVEMNFPKGKVIRDTLEYRMAKPNGELLGTGLTSVKENKLWYKENVVFSETGTYTVNIKQAMRNNGDINGVTNLEGITDVGFRIEDVK
ncbi:MULTISPECIES: gliding motility lipoprotein GldH [unclassified Lacinutrix]|uniref:gliding motility lipoprotein GldH n=1 Tax=unclassified Lacinutrix TaxID=2647285 RepID=UPI00020A3991|nr:MULTISPECIES: gliding motility lipoprotein GldH [unclassified Lacinutrix]AEH00941.1 gliding motility-associated lipoprotein GldH [Lacinutrix sp. 5H-3-7-4]OIQ23562.1 MAG: gliding motility lipoprotein GldH [Lacinutrix sp. MedPE-SW]